MSHGSSQAKHGAETARGLDPDDFARMYEKSHRVLWLVAASATQRPGMADDVLQDAATLALTKLHDFTPGTNYTAWMAQFVRFVALNTNRRERRRQPVADVSAVHPALDDSIERKSGVGLTETRGQLPADQAHFDDDVIRALQAIPETARACLLLRTIENLDYAEISEMLQIPAGTAMSHVFRSRAAMRAALRGRGTRSGPSEDESA